MKSVGVAILFICLLLQTFSKRAILVETLGNSNYTLTVICPDADTSKKSCVGLCHFKHFDTGDQESQPNRGRSYKHYSSEVATNFTDQLDRFKTSYPSFHHNIHFSQYKERKYSAPHFSLFHPPGV